MHRMKTINQPAITFGSATPWMSLFSLAIVPLFALQFSLVVTLQIVALLSVAMVALAHISVANEKHFDAAYLAIKLIAPMQFVLMIWLSVYMGREIAGASFALSFATSMIYLFGIVIVDGFASAALALVAGSHRAVTGPSMVTLISAKYAGLLGKVE